MSRDRQTEIVELARSLHGTELVIIDYMHEKIHKGKLFTASYIDASVDNNEAVLLRLKQGATKELHALLSMNSSGLWLFESFIGTTYTADGTEIPYFNRYTESTETLETTLYHTPTVNVLGSARLSFYFGSGTNPAQAETGFSEERLESIFGANTDILVRVTNKSGGTLAFSAVFNNYEE